MIKVFMELLNAVLLPLESICWFLGTYPIALFSFAIPMLIVTDPKADKRTIRISWLSIAVSIVIWFIGCSYIPVMNLRTKLQTQLTNTYENEYYNNHRISFDDNEKLMFKGKVITYNDKEGCLELELEKTKEHIIIDYDLNSFTREGVRRLTNSKILNSSSLITEGKVITLLGKYNYLATSESQRVNSNTTKKVIAITNARTLSDTNISSVFTPITFAGLLISLLYVGARTKYLIQRLNSEERQKRREASKIFTEKLEKAFQRS